MSRCISATVLGGIGTPSSVRNAASRCGALRSIGLKPRMPSRASARLQAVGDPGAFGNEIFALTARALRVFVRECWDRDHAAMSALAA